jgi:hypothetical protein
VSQVGDAVSQMDRVGWRTLGEALSSLPGIHLTYDRQHVCSQP